MLNTLTRVNGGTGTEGNPGLMPISEQFVHGRNKRQTLYVKQSSSRYRLSACYKFQPGSDPRMLPASASASASASAGNRRNVDSVRAAGFWG